VSHTNTWSGRIALGLALLVGLGGFRPVAAQQEATRGPIASPTIGVDWMASGDFVDAAGDLVEMAEVGFTAVRMPPVYDRDFFSLADSLGLTLYIELPFAQSPVQQLRQELAEADSLLSLVLDAGRGHSSAGPIGITRLSDTRSSGACEAISSVAERIRAAGRQAYYTTLFREQDQCRDVVDFVLIDILHPHGDLAEIDHLMDRAGVSAEAGFGIAGLGAAVTLPDAEGWSVAGSPHAQARFMETALNRVRASNLSHVFVHRWRDQSQGFTGLLESTAFRESVGLPDPWGRAYGLYTSTSDPRPALQVVRGILLGLQDTFAFDEGVAPKTGRPWFPVLGWLMITLTALMYAGSPRFRSMIPRYFFAHGFFRNAVREAREVLPLTSTAILTVTGLSIGLIGSFIITGLKDLPLTIHWYRLFGEGTRSSLTAILNVPFVLTVLIGSATLLSTSLWMGCWMAITGRRTRLLPSQALMLASWPRWQVLLLLPIAMTLQAKPGIPLWPILLLAAAWLGTGFWATIRTSYDLYKITNVSPLAAVLVWFIHPLVIAAFILIGWSLFNWDQVRFAWHLLQVG
jgi:hypothetical protein